MSSGIKHSILVVDDEPEILFSLQGLLRLEFMVHTAENAREAIEIMQQTPIHIVLTDQRMPEMTGVELLSKLRVEWPDAVRLVFTGYADVKAVIDAVNEGRIFRYLVKPWDPDELWSVLREACDEYDRTIERRRLLVDLREFHARTLKLIESLREGGHGVLDDADLAQVDQIAGASTGMLERLEGAIEPPAAG